MWGSTKANTPDECTWKNAPFNGGNPVYDANAFNSVKDTAYPNGILAKKYDAATQIMGGDWRMPTEADFNELLNGTTNEWMTINGVNGWKFTSRINGNSIFIPAAGDCRGGSVGNVDYYGSVWSSSLNASGPSSAWYLDFYSVNCGMSSGYRCNGLSVRGVRE